MSERQGHTGRSRKREASLFGISAGKGAGTTQPSWVLLESGGWFIEMEADLQVVQMEAD